MNSGAYYEVQKVGVYNPYMKELNCLSAGEVGFIIANIKDAGRFKIGDTITLKENPAKNPLSGFKEPKPMVFAGIYPIDANDYPELKDSIEKLKLNDPSFSYEPENSLALGFGFRCGFLGLLHMEIVQERLEREYQLELISTAPTVIYEVLTTDGQVLKISNPAELPAAQKIADIREPVITANILVPETYLGPVIALCEERRGRQKNMQFTGGQVMLRYELPHNEVVLDFLIASNR